MRACTTVVLGCLALAACGAPEVVAGDGEPGWTAGGEALQQALATRRTWAFATFERLGLRWDVAGGSTARLEVRTAAGSGAVSG